MKLRKFTKRKSPLTGKPYPQCQSVSSGEQCTKPVYADGFCWQHQYPWPKKSTLEKLDIIWKKR